MHRYRVAINPLIMPRIAIPLGHAPSHRPHVVHCHGKGEAEISSVRPSSTCLNIRLTLKPLSPVIGQAELQHPHCSHALNIFTLSGSFSANWGLLSICPYFIYKIYNCSPPASLKTPRTQRLFFYYFPLRGRKVI